MKVRKILLAKHENSKKDEKKGITIIHCNAKRSLRAVVVWSALCS